MTSIAQELPATEAVTTEEATSRRRARARRRLIGRAMTYAAAVLMALWVLAPIYLITITAFSPREVVYGYPKDLTVARFVVEVMD